MPNLHAGPSLPDRYRVVRHVANGGMAGVWAAEDALLGRLVAVKVLAAHIAEDRAARRRFEREARTAARVSDHPNVVTIYDVGEHAGLPFIVMELLSSSVADRLREGVPIPRSQSVDWLGQAAAALDYAHGEDIVHRDVKPANLLLDDRSRLAVGDFGIAVLVDDSALTQAGMVLGTAAYLSPEQASGERATAASDRYALGVVAFELLTGRRPFGGPHLAAQARAHLEAPVPPSELGPEVDEVLGRALAKDPDARYLTAGRFVEELRAAVGRPAGAATAAAPVPAPVPVAAAPPGPPTRAAAAPPGPPTRAEGPPRHVAIGPEPVTTHRARRTGGAAKALLAVLAAAVLAVALFAVLGGGDGDEERTAGERTATQRTQPRTQEEPPATQPPADTAPAPAPAAPDPAPAEPEPEPEPAPEPEPEPEPQPAPDTEGEGEGDPGPATAGAESPEELNDQGFAALQAGDAARAVALLERADAGFEAQGDAANPLTWGYALYNLGLAYEAAGRPADAAAAYERRLEVSPNDQRRVVRRALARARAAADGG